MGFDLLLAGGTDNRLFGEALMGCIVEVRVEQKLDEPTQFGIRFLDDIEEGQSMKAGVSELQLGELVTIVVGDDDGYACLSRGPILERNAQVTLGGPGSWFEVRGLDRRDELAREFREGNWAGRASDVAATLLSPVYPNSQIDPTEKNHDFDNEPLPQRGTDLEFLKKNAIENGYHFWISYSDVREDLGGRLHVTETANWRASPPLQDAPALGLPPVLSLGDDAPTLRLNVPTGQCPNVTQFQLREDGTRPSQVRTATQNLVDGGQEAVNVTDQASPMGGIGEGLSGRAPVRFMVPQPQGNAQSARTINEAALRESGFFVSAEASTSRFMLGGVLEPHQVVAVEGLGGANGTTPFRVESVVHVINGEAHHMDVKMSTNAQVET